MAMGNQLRPALFFYQVDDTDFEKAAELKKQIKDLEQATSEKAPHSRAGQRVKRLEWRWRHSSTCLRVRFGSNFVFTPENSPSQPQV